LVTKLKRVTLPEIQTRALRALVQQLRARKRAATKVRSPTPMPTPSSSPVAERRSRIALDAAPARASAHDAAPALRYPRKRWSGFDQLREGIEVRA